MRYGILLLSALLQIKLPVGVKHGSASSKVISQANLNCPICFGTVIAMHQTTAWRFTLNPFDFYVFKVEKIATKGQIDCHLGLS
jgi:hypothetical protein